jgi:hypothetical protein
VEEPPDDGLRDPAPVLVRDRHLHPLDLDPAQVGGDLVVLGLVLEQPEQPPGLGVVLARVVGEVVLHVDRIPPPVEDLAQLPDVLFAVGGHHE